jgi:DNA mismatch repair protein MutS
MELLQKFLNKSDEIDPENKKEHELNTADRMILINKKTDENFLIETYENLIKTKKFINIEDIHSVDINDYVFDDVEFTHDHYLNNDKGLFYKLDKSSTKIGSLLLKNIFLKPIYDIDVLKNRQDIIKKIYNAKNDIIPILNEIKLLENDLIWFWNNSNLNHIDLMNDLIYFNYDIIPFFNMNEVLNNNEKALLITNIYKIIVSPILTILTPLMSLLIPLVVLFYMKSRVKLDISLWEITKQYFKTLFGSDSMKMIFTSPTKAMMASFATKGIYLFMYLQNIYYTFQSAASTNKIINIIHEKLNKMTQYVKLSDKLKTVCEAHHINDLTDFISYSNIKEDIHVYENYFNFPVFNNDPKLFSNKGKILSTFKKFKENKESMISIFHYTGIIDALTSIGNIVMMSTDENPYCYTTFLNKKVPTVNIKNIWHPYLDKHVMKTTVKNSIDIKNNILITGPNAGGKSTFIKSVILNIILSQTVGISSAESFEMTPFKLIETYLHIPDSKGTSSLFEAEMFRSKDYIEKIKSLEKTDFSFIVLDEIFSSTNYIEGFSGAYSILKKLSSFRNTLSITTTHYTDLEILEKDTKGKIVNYKFEVDYKDGEIIFNYLLKKGISRQYIALDLLKKNGFDEDIIEDAIKMCKRIKSMKLFTKK